MTLPTPAPRPRTLCAFDLETTGVDVETDRIVTAAIVVVDYETGDTLERLELLLDPGVEIPAPASAIHGVTTEHAREHGMPAREGIMRIVAALADRLFTEAGDPTGDPLIVYNAPFDLTLLDREWRRHLLIGLEETVNGDGKLEPSPWYGPTRVPVIDPLVLDKHFDRYRRGPRNLSTVAGIHGVETPNAHNAAADALTAALIARRMLRSVALAEATLGSIHTASVRWAADQADGLRAYYQGRGDLDRAASVVGEWPARVYLGSE